MLYLIATVVILTSCSERPTRVLSIDNQLHILDFTREYTPTKTRLDEITEHVRIIRMETTPESLLRTIRAEFSENYILCLTGKSALLFDQKGSFLGKVGRKGKGPGEFSGNSKWTIDEENNVIYCYNSYDSRMVRYNLHNRQMESNFITETKGSLQSMIVLNKDSIFAIRHVNRIFPYQYYYLNTNGEFLDGKPWDTTRYFHSGMYSTPFLQKGNNNRIILQPSNNDTIFEIGGIDSYPIMTFKKKTFPKRGGMVKFQRLFLKGMDVERNAILEMITDERIMEGDFIVTTNLIGLSMFTYDSKEHEIEKIQPLVFDYRGLELSLDQYYFKVKGINSFYVSIPVIDILEKCDQYLETNPETERAAKVIELSESLDINSNPLLITGEWKL